MIIKLVRPFLHAEVRQPYDVLRVEDEYVEDNVEALKQLTNCRDWLIEEIEKMTERKEDTYEIQEVSALLDLVKEQISDIEKYG